MQINELPSLGRALQSGDQLAVDDANGVTYKVDAENINPTPATISIPTGRWSGSGSDYYITVTASNVTADSILIPQYDVSSAALLKGPVWCVPAAGSFTIHTSAKPSGTVTILVLFPGTMGEAQYEVLADVYSKSQVDSIVAQSTANPSVRATYKSTDNSMVMYAVWGPVCCVLIRGCAANNGTVATLPDEAKPRARILGTGYIGSSAVPVEITTSGAVNLYVASGNVSALMTYLI